VPFDQVSVQQCDVRTRFCDVSRLVVACLIAFPATGLGQEFADLRKQYESGQYQAVADAVGAMTDRSPRVWYLTAQTYEKLGLGDQLRDAYNQLAGGTEENPWTFVGRSAIAVLDKNFDEGVNAANQAITLDAALPEAYFQLGLAEAFRQNFESAAAALDKATELDPQFGYAHYQAGLAHYRNKRPDRMASHFEMFLTVAPQAPERPEVESILRTLRGR